MRVGTITAIITGASVRTRGHDPALRSASDGPSPTLRLVLIGDVDRVSVEALLPRSEQG